MSGGEAGAQMGRRRIDLRWRVGAAAAAVLGALFAAWSCASQRPRAEGERLEVGRLEGVPQIRVAAVKGAAEVRLAVVGQAKVFVAGRRDRSILALDGLAECLARPTPEGVAIGRYAIATQAVDVVPEAGAYLRVDGVDYRGEMRVERLEGGAVRVVNRLTLEEYLRGVVGCEMPAKWHEEALRAQAVAARTYAFYMMKVREREPYDVGADTSSQVYRGLTGESDGARRAVETTRGLILAWRFQVFCTYFHSTCGGHTIPARAVFTDAPEIPPLGGATCGFCEGTKYSRWTYELAAEELQKRLAEKGVPVGKGIETVDVAYHEDGMYAARVRLRFQGGEVEMPAYRFRLSTDPSGLRSAAFTVAWREDRTLRFEGRGWGHGVGLCQTGAKGMAEAGHDAASILARYYPGAQLVRIY